MSSLSARVPYTALTGQLAWTNSGRVWAGWRIVNPLAYGERSVRDKEKVADTHRALWQSLSGETLVQGLVTNIDPEVTVRRMLARHAPESWEKFPGAVAEAEATLEQLQDIVLGERTFWLWVPLKNLGWDVVGESWRSSVRELKDWMGAPVTGVSVQEVQARQQQADEIGALIPHVLAARPVTPAERLWVWAHSCSRGLWSAPPDGLSRESVRVHSGCAVPEPVLDVGGRTDDQDGAVGVQNPLSRRYLKVSTVEGEDLGRDASYQTMMAIRDFPMEGMAFPGSEYLGAIDNFGVMADWTVRLRVNSRDKVLKATQRAVRTLNDQYSQQDAAEQGQHALDLSARMLTDYQQIFTNHPDELDVEHTTILTTAGRSPEECQSAAKQLVAAMKAVNIKLDRPMGKAQERLWWASTPDTPTNATTRRYYQRTTASDFSLAVPFTTTRVGDTRGWLVAFNRSVPTMTAAVHLAMMDKPLKGGSASCGVGGELGAGKTYLLKELSGFAVDDGAQVVTIDNTTEGEWAHFASMSVEDALIVQCQEPNSSMDLLRVFGPDRGSGPMLGFLTALMQTGLNTAKGVVLASVLTPAYLEEHKLDSTAAVMRHLLDGKCDLEDSVAVGNHMRTHAARPHARVVFDDDLPVATFDSPFIVFRTNGLRLPDRDVLTNEHLFSSMPPEQVFGRAYYALLAQAVAEIAAMDRSRFTFWPVDEAAGLMLSPEGEAGTVRFVREGRRNNQAAALGSQNPSADFGSKTLKELLTIRLMMRIGSEPLAADNLQWVGLDDKDPGFQHQVERLSKQTSPQDEDGNVPTSRRGEGIMRDSRGDIAWIQVRQPGNPLRRQALESDPPPAEEVLL